MWTAKIGIFPTVWRIRIQISSKYCCAYWTNFYSARSVVIWTTFWLAVYIELCVWRGRSPMRIHWHNFRLHSPFAVLIEKTAKSHENKQSRVTKGKLSSCFLVEVSFSCEGSENLFNNAVLPLENVGFMLREEGDCNKKIPGNKKVVRSQFRHEPFLPFRITFSALSLHEAFFPWKKASSSAAQLPELRKLLYSCRFGEKFSRTFSTPCTSHKNICFSCKLETKVVERKYLPPANKSSISSREENSANKQRDELIKTS